MYVLSLNTLWFYRNVCQGSWLLSVFSKNLSAWKIVFQSFVGHSLVTSEGHKETSKNTVFLWPFPVQWDPRVIAASHKNISVCFFPTKRIHRGVLTSSPTEYVLAYILFENVLRCVGPSLGSCLPSLLPALWSGILPPFPAMWWWDTLSEEVSVGGLHSQCRAWGPGIWTWVRSTSFHLVTPVTRSGWTCLNPAGRKNREVYGCGKRDLIFSAVKPKALRG